jgi:hypothetical protein
MLIFIGNPLITPSSQLLRDPRKANRVTQFSIFPLLMEHHVISSILRRSGPNAKRRALVLLYALSSRMRNETKKRRAGVQGTSGTEPSEGEGKGLGLWPPEVGLSDINTILLYLVSAPRFLWAVGEKGAVLRSPDRGVTWRKLELQCLTQAPSTNAQRQTPSNPPQTSPQVPDPPIMAQNSSETARPSFNNPDSSQGSDDGCDLSPDELAKILALIPDKAGKGDDAERGAEDSGSEEEKTPHPRLPTGSAAAAVTALSSGSTQASPDARPDLFCVCCSGDSVAVGGSLGFVALSQSRGLGFVRCDVGGFSKANFRDVRFAAEGKKLLMVAGRSLYEALIDPTGGFKGPATKVSDFASSVGALTIFNQREGAEEWCISTQNALHFCWDNGKSWVSVPHGLGLIRAMQDLTNELYDDELEAIRSSSIQSSAQAGEGQAEGATQTTKAGAKDRESTRKYSYGSRTTFQQSSYPMLDALLFRAGAQAPSTKKPKGVRVLGVLGTGGPIVPYDFTGLLVLAEVPNPGAPDAAAPPARTILTTVQNLQHVPFVTSGPHDKVGLLIWRPKLAQHSTSKSRLPLKWVRSTSGGVSVSVDGGTTFSMPQLAYTGNMVRLDDDCIVAANLKKSIAISEDNGSNWGLRVVDNALRVATIHSIALMQ